MITAGPRSYRASNFRGQKAVGYFFAAVQIMVVILDGNSEIGAHVRSNLCYLICLWHLLRAHFSSPKTPIFIHVRATCVLSYHHGQYYVKNMNLKGKEYLYSYIYIYLLRQKSYGSKKIFRRRSSTHPTARATPPSPRSTWGSYSYF